MNAQAIMMSHKLSARIMGMEVAAGWNKDAYKDDFMITMETVIANLQRAILEPHDKVIDELNMLNGFPDLVGIRRSVKHPLMNLFTDDKID